MAASDHASEVTAVRPRRGRGNRLSLVDRHRLLTLHKQHPEWTTRQLGEAAGTSHESARRAILVADTATHELMATLTEPVLREWRKAIAVASTRGDHRPAKEWLLHSGTLEQLPDARGSGPSITIVNAPLPGMPNGPTVTEVRLVSPASRDDDR